MVFVVGEGHRLEVQSHGGSALDVADLVQAGGRVRVGVEELGGLGSHLWEVWVGSAGVPLLIVVDNVVGLWSKQFSDSLVGEDGIENVDLVDGWLGSLVSDSSEQSQSSDDEVDLPDEGLRSHQEAEGSPSEESARPAVVGSVQSGSDLIEIVGGSHPQLPVVSLENIAAIRELVWVSLSLSWLEAVSSSNRRVELEEVAIVALGWLESLVVVPWVSVSSAAEESAWGFLVVVVLGSSEGSEWSIGDGGPGELQERKE